MISKKIENYVFDNTTHKSLYKLSSNNILEAVDMPIASGKEAITFLAHNKDVPLAAKIYKIETSNFKHLNKYIAGDYRFKNVKKDTRSIFLVWASKEYKNLKLMLENNVSCPVPIAKERNILVMSFLGEDSIAYPKLIHTKFDFDKVYPQLIDNYAKILYGANLVHADFSAYNILINPDNQKIFVIDVGQAVLKNHPKAKHFLKKDIINITNFLNKKFPHKNLKYEDILNNIKSKKDEIYGRDN